MIIFGSGCSGIESASVAWHPLGWRAAWFAENDAVPSAILAHRWPNVKNHGDFMGLRPKIERGEILAPDVFVAGTPCQSFSVAGWRQGFDDSRGQLTLEYVRIADAIDEKRKQQGKPATVCVWENVPGVLSDKKNAFGCFIAGLAGEDGELIPSGGKWSNAGVVIGPTRTVAWRILDAQYFGVAQRRRRVFVVASARDNFDPATVLFEFEGVRRDSAPSRQAREGVAGGVEIGPGGGRFTDLSPTLDTRAKDGPIRNQLAGAVLQTFDRQSSGEYGTQPVASTVSARDYKSATDLVAQPIALHPTQDPISSEDGTTHCMGTGSSQGNATVAVAHVLCEALYNKGFNHESTYASTQETDTGKILRTLREAVGEETFAKWGLGILDSLQPPEILRQALHGVSIRPASFSRSWVVYCALSRQKDGPGWLLQSLREAGCEGCSPQGWEPPEQLAGQLGAYLSELSQPGAQAARFMRDLWWAAQGAGVLREALSAVQKVGRPVDGKSQPAHGGMQVRRLTPEDAEFLQGFPRGYTAIPWRKKPASDCPDGPRYKALGNSWAVPVVRWIGQRIQLSVEITKHKEKQ